MIGTIEAVWAVMMLVKPEYGDILFPRIDNRVWYGIALAFMFVAFLRMLKVASNYKKRIESTDNIRLVYNEKKYKACKERKSDKEIYRVGIRVIGNEAVESLIIIPTSLVRVDGDSYQEIQISQIKLHPMTGKTEVIYRGFTPSYYVDVFSHAFIAYTLGSSSINMCYDDYTDASIELTNGQYELMLSARAKPKTIHMGTMVITMIDGNINVRIKKWDYLGG